VTLAIESDTTGCFPSSGLNEAFSVSLNQNLFEGLVAFEALFKIVPALAERWENPDDRTYRFAPRAGLRAVLPLAFPYEAFALSPRVAGTPRPDRALRPAELRPVP
jgi:hypothetical protein